MIKEKICNWFYKKITELFWEKERKELKKVWNAKDVYCSIPYIGNKRYDVFINSRYSLLRSFHYVFNQIYSQEAIDSLYGVYFSFSTDDNTLTVTIITTRPGKIIGTKGKLVDKLKQDLKDFLLFDRIEIKLIEEKSVFAWTEIY